MIWIGGGVAVVGHVGRLGPLAFALLALGFGLFGELFRLGPLPSWRSKE
ncbi:MAG: hypothetical protein WDM85_04870 [Caulobacteraceae bacterium]